MTHRGKEKRGFSIKLKRNQIIFILGIVAIAAFIFLYDLYMPRPLTAINYDGIVLNFRADLKEARNIAVYPSEQVLYDALVNPSVENITIAVKPAGEENPIYSVQTFELVTKLEIAYLTLGLNPNFDREPLIIESYENLTGEPQNPVIALVHPIYSNETEIRIENDVVFVKAKDYKDFDLAIAKLLMVALRIKI